jgi:DHA1 family multidrug resistance protein-like MFS transporter
MYDTGQALGTPELPWFLLGVVGVLTLILLYWQFNQRSIAPAVLGGS